MVLSKHSSDLTVAPRPPLPIAEAWNGVDAGIGSQGEPKLTWGVLAICSVDRPQG